MPTAKGTARAKKAWITRRKRYGKDGLMDTKRDVRETVKHIFKGTQRRRPATHYYKGDQIRPLSQTRAGKRQWRRSQLLDAQRPGTKYEAWERMRVKSSGHPKGLDRWVNEWAHVRDLPPKGKAVKLVRLTGSKK